MPPGTASAAGAHRAWGVPGVECGRDGADLAFTLVMAIMRLGLAACLAAGALACTIEINPDPDTAATAPAAGEAAAARGGATLDSAAGTLHADPSDTMPVAPDTAPRASATAVRDTTPIGSTPAELSALAASLVVPVEGVPVSALRDSYDEARGAGGSRVHRALDIHAPRGTPVIAATDGRVLRMHESKAGGLMVYQADATDRFILMYGHLERYAAGLADGAPVRRGQVIGYVGTSGNAAPDAPHLHFVVARGRPSASWWRGTPVNPYPLLVR